MQNTCWNCKHDKLKLDVLVPHNRTVKEYVHRTENIQSDMVALVKGKKGQYTVLLRSESDTKLVTIVMLHVCALRIERTKNQVTCPCFRENKEGNLISSIIYSKQSITEAIETKH